MIEIAELGNMSFHPSESADKIFDDLQHQLGLTARYYTAKLAIARSLSEAEHFGLEVKDNSRSTELRGHQLFGRDTKNLAAWLALIVQHSGAKDLKRDQFRQLIYAHLDRGAKLLQGDWEASGHEFEPFVNKLAKLASAPKPSETQTLGAQVSPVFRGKIELHVGPTAKEVRTQEPVVFKLNIEGGSPHMALMGGTNSGKTYTAITMLKELRALNQVPMLAFDFKGDLSEKLAPVINARVISPPQETVPLDIFAMPDCSDIGIKTTAAKLRESILRVKVRPAGGIQRDLLRKALIAALQTGAHSNRPPNLGEVASALQAEYDDAGQKPDELVSTLNELCEFDLFAPKYPPADFFAKSWVIRLPQDGSEETRRLIVNLTLDALDRWINAQNDAPMEKRYRALRHVCMLDEAHVILSTKLPALGNLIKMSRSKGGCLMLASQSPDDFTTGNKDLLNNMGLTLAFATQARPTSVNNVFGSHSRTLNNLERGKALCKFRGEETKRILAWTPGN